MLGIIIPFIINIVKKEIHCMMLYFVGFSDDLENGMEIVVAKSKDEAMQKVKDMYNLPDDLFVYADLIDMVDGYKIHLEKI